MIYFTAHTFKCVCHCRRAMFRVLGMYNFGNPVKFLSFSLDRQPDTLSKCLVCHFVKSFSYLRMLKTCQDFSNHGQGELVIMRLF